MESGRLLVGLRVLIIKRSPMAGVWGESLMGRNAERPRTSPVRHAVVPRSRWGRLRWLWLLLVPLLLVGAWLFADWWTCLPATCRPRMSDAAAVWNVMPPKWNNGPDRTTIGRWTWPRTTPCWVISTMWSSRTMASRPACIATAGEVHDSHRGTRRADGGLRDQVHVRRPAAAAVHGRVRSAGRHAGLRDCPAPGAADFVGHGEETMDRLSSARRAGATQSR